MTSSSDFRSSYDYEKLFTSLSEKLEENGYSNSYHYDDEHDVVSFEMDAYDRTVNIAVFDEPYNAIHIAFELVLPVAELDDFCNKVNSNSRHIIFWHEGDIVHAHVQVPVLLGEGWDDLACDEAVLAVKEIEEFLDTKLPYLV